MLRLKVFINKEQIDEIRIENLRKITKTKHWYFAVQFGKYYQASSSLLVPTKHAFVDHNRKKGWENLVIKVLKKFLKEKR